ncbi:InlB B-repeat-containing protein, partial [Peptoniphilus genitalis]
MKNNKILGLLLAGVMVTSIPFNVFADGPTGGATKEPAEITEPAEKNQPVDKTKPSTEPNEEDKKENETPVAEKVKVTFESNEGSSVPEQTIDKNGTATDQTPERPGYDFKGWYTDNVTFKNKFSFDTKIQTNTTLYAKWEKKEDKPVVPVKQSLSISKIEYNGKYVSGKVTADGEPVYNATVTLKIDGTKTYRD